jgi:transmembrane sensor
MSAEMTMTNASDEAARWYARRHAAAPTTAEQAAFEAWRNGSAANAEAWAATEATHDALGGLAALPEMTALRSAARRPAGAAGTYSLISHRAPTTTAPAVAAVAHYRTAIGEQRIVALADGTRMTLNTDSQIDVPAWQSERRIRLLRGEGYFEVAKDKSHPFVVETGAGDVVAVGTAFAVRKAGRGFSVALAEGKVRVTIPAIAEPALLTPGERLAYDGVAVKRETSGAGEATTWLAGNLTFRDTVLGDAIAEMNRYSPRKIVLDDPAAAHRKLTGVFRTGDVATFVAAVTAYGMARIEREDAAEIRLKGA